jgi:osmotically-inducible protein OsmY
MSQLTDLIEREVEKQAGLPVIVEEDGRRLVVTGMASSEEEKQAALDIARAFAPDRDIDDDIDIATLMPELGDLELATEDAGAFRGADEDAERETALEPGDFTDQPLLVDPLAAAGPTLSEDDEVAEGNVAYVPPIDPVFDDRGAVLGGFSLSSIDQLEADRSAEDGLPGDEALADAIARELREDSLTIGLDIHVRVRNGIARLRGRVSLLLDAENAEEVASRVPGVRDVIEELDVDETR